MKKNFTRTVTITATAMLIGTMPFTATGVLATENKYPAIATYNEIATPQTTIYDELEAVAPQADVEIPGTEEIATSGKWGTCDWNFEDGVLTISGGVGTSTAISDGEYVTSNVPWGKFQDKITKINIEGEITFEEGTLLSCLFEDHSFTGDSLKEINGLDKLDTSNVTDMRYMFFNCEALENLDLSSWDTSNVANMGYMFLNCEALKSLDLSKWDTSNVTDMSCMFEDCYNLKTLDVSNFNTSKVTNMREMFCGCESLKTLDVSSFDTSQVKNMTEMFGDCENLKTLDVSSFNTSQVIDMGFMFSNCSNLESLDLSKFDTSNLKSMYKMFLNCPSLKEVSMDNFNTTNLTSMTSVFEGCNNLEILDLSSFDLGNVEYSDNFILNCTNLKKLVMPKSLGTKYKDTIINNIKSGMSENVSWKDRTDNQVYSGKPDTLIESHNYVVTGSVYDKDEDEDNNNTSKDDTNKDNNNTSKDDTNKDNNDNNTG